jgi:hypothetical protein
MVVGVRRNNCPVIVDVGGGWGAEAYGALNENGTPAVAYLGNKPSQATTREGNPNSSTSAPRTGGASVRS